MKSDFNYFDEIVPADMYSRTKATIYQNIAIFDICNLMYLSPNHFKRMFKEHTGRTPHQYLIDIRLEKAKELLRTKNFHRGYRQIMQLCKRRTFCCDL